MSHNFKSLEEAVTVYDGFLKGLSVYMGEPFVNDMRKSLLKSEDPILIENAFNRNQVGCKKWLVENLEKHPDLDLGHVLILGGWYGVLGGLLLNSQALKVKSVVSSDIDPSCETIAQWIHKKYVDQKKFFTLTLDMYAIDYENGLEVHGKAWTPSTVVNTSCEHIENVPAWLDLIPSGVNVIVQSNNYWGQEGHINCKETLQEFKKEICLSKYYLCDELKLEKYNRYLIIGQK